MHRQRFLFSALALLTVWRLVLLPTSELSPAEAMSAVAASQPGWSWCGTSPLLTLLAKIGLLVSGRSEYGVRLFAPLLAFAASVLTFRLAKELFDEQTAAWSVVILNVLPAFNLAAIHLTPGSVAVAGHAGLALSVAVAVRRTGKWHRAWLGAAACMAALVFADGGNVVALAAVVCAFLITPGWRPRLAQPEFWLVVAAWFAGVIAWLNWNLSHHWPCGGVSEQMPDWRIIPGVFRWLLMASPMVVYLLVRQSRQLVGGVRSGNGNPSSAFLIGLALPLVIVDFGWGVWRAWPDAGHGVWLLFAAVLLAHHSRQMLPLSLEAKVSIRTMVIGLAIVQSVLVMRTDLLRSAGLPWEFSQRADERRTYTRFLSADPSGAMNGWRETAKIVSQVIASDPSGEWSLIADQWQLGAPVSFYAGGNVQPAFRVFEHGALTAWPGADQTKCAPGSKALFITADARCKAVPPALARCFEQTKIISVADIMHGGHKVRTVKIFACLHYRAPDL